MKNKTEFSDDFKIFHDPVFKNCQFKISPPEPEAESREYQASRFKINDKFVHYRHAKVTPTKVGQFVTLWKRKPGKSILPYDSSDEIDLFVVTVRARDRWGQFIFPKSILIQRGVLSVNGRGGKRAIRVYPLWDVTESSQAKKTQAWQAEFFAEISQTKPLDIQKFKWLLSL